MIVTVEIPPATKRRISSDARKAAGMDKAMADAMNAAVAVGADVIVEGLVMGKYGLTMQHPASGLAASTRGWMIDLSGPVGALGVPSDSPAAAYADILERGGVITPKKGRALAVPVSAEAKQYSSPRDMADLTLIPRKGRPPLLVREIVKGGGVTGFELHWVLVPHVTIPAFHWLSQGAKDAKGDMSGVFGDVLSQHLGAN